MTTYSDFQNQKKDTERNTRLVYDMKQSIMKIDRFILERLSPIDLQRLVFMFHPSYGLTQLSSSEQMEKEDIVGRVIALIKIDLGK